MAVRQKQKVLDIAYKHFKDFELPLDIEYKSYVDIIGAKDAVHAISVKRSFKAWKYLLHALKKHHPDLIVKPEPAPKPAPKPATKAAPKPASKTAKAEKKSEE